MFAFFNVFHEHFFYDAPLVICPLAIDSLAVLDHRKSAFHIADIDDKGLSVRTVICNMEVEPTLVALRVGVHAQHHIVHSFPLLPHTLQVAALLSTLKQNVFQSLPYNLTSLSLAFL